MKRYWHIIVIAGLWAGLMYQFWDMWRMGLLADKPYILIPELILITLIAISGCIMDLL